MQTTNIQIGGISCMGCVSTLTRVLTGIEGVQSAQIDKDSAMAKVEFDPAVTNADEFRQAIEDAGYDVV